MTTPSRILPHFKSTNTMPTTHRTRAFTRRDHSSMARFESPTEPLAMGSPSQHLATTLTEAGLGAPSKVKSLLQSTLPDIPTKRQKIKRSSYLEMWLEEALEPREGQVPVNPSPEKQVEKTGPLVTLQKFELDRKYLRTQNIAPETIDKLYNSLYVYTHGIDNAFKELVEMASGHQDSVQKKVLNNFWKAFLRLLEGCTSFRTTQQIIDEDHFKQVEEIKEACLRREEQLVAQNAQLEGEIGRLNKTIAKQANELSKMENDYRISAATLELTDNAFNSEVHMRLKFQEKINAMFNSYAEIKMKYEGMLERIKEREDEESLNHSVIGQLRQQYEKTLTKLTEAERQLVLAREVVDERNQQFLIKQQELSDANVTIGYLREREEGQEEALTDATSQTRTLQHQLKAQLADCTARSRAVEELQQRIEQYEREIAQVRESNEQLYHKCENSGKEVGELKKEVVEKRQVAERAVAQAEEWRVDLQNIQNEKEGLETELELVRHKLAETEGELAIKTANIDRTKALVNSLEAAKNKYERIYEMAMEAKGEMEVAMTEAVRTREKAVEEMEGLQLLMENSKNELEEANIKLTSEREVFRKRIHNLKEEVQAKESQILAYHNQQVEDEEKLSKVSLNMEAARREADAAQEQKLQLEAQILQLSTKCQDAERQRSSMQKSLMEVSGHLEAEQALSRKQSHSLSNNRSQLEHLEANSHQELNQVKDLMQEYYEGWERKVSFIHPMIIEDLTEQLNRCSVKINGFREETERIEREHQEVLAGKEQVIEEQVKRISELEETLEKERMNSERLQSLVDQLRSADRINKATLKNNQKELSQAKLNITSLQQSIKQTQSERDQLKKTLKTSQSQEQSMGLQLAQFQDKAQRLNEELAEAKDKSKEMTSEKARLQSEFSKLQAEIARRDMKGRKNSVAHDRKNSIGQGSSRRTAREAHNTSQPKVNPSQKLESRGSTDRPRMTETARLPASTQTDRPKFDHSSKFELGGSRSDLRKIPNADYGCQVAIKAEQEGQIESSKSEDSCFPPSAVNSPHPQPHLPAYEYRRVEGNEFKRALKITYMRQ